MLHTTIIPSLRVLNLSTANLLDSEGYRTKKTAATMHHNYIFHCEIHLYRRVCDQIHAFIHLGNSSLDRLHISRTGLVTSDLYKRYFSSTNA